MLLLTNHRPDEKYGRGTNIVRSAPSHGSDTAGLTAATPVDKGFLVDTDVRWNIYAASIDDRTREECGDIKETRRFDMIQNTNWQTLRFKPPPSLAEETGPASRGQINGGKIDENMETAHARDAVVSRLFFFRTKSTPETVDPELPNGGPYTNGGDSQDRPSEKNSGAVADEYRAMSINEIINGGSSSSSSREEPPGLIPLIEKYLYTCDYDSTTRSRLDEYLNFIKERANGDGPIDDGELASMFHQKAS
ncbi:MAG: hypothetical protein Q9161_002045 [Pseudevernia consocians]